MKTPENLQEHPYYRRVLEPQLIFHKRKLECLHKRQVLISNGSASKSEYQKNEDELLQIKTVVEIQTLGKYVAEREGYYIQFLKKFLADLEEMNIGYDALVAKAQKSNDPQIQTLLSQLEFNVVGQQTNIEGKVSTYQRMVNLLK